MLAVLASGLLVISGCGPSTDPAAARSAATNRPAASDQAMAALRTRFLETALADLGLPAVTNAPRVAGVLMDWPMDDVTVSVVALADGSASLYTSSSFGIIGGGAHPTVRAAALDVVRLAATHHDAAVPTNRFPYPSDGRVRFYLKTSSDTRVRAAALADLTSGKDPCAPLWNAAQRLVAELRLASPGG